MRKANLIAMLLVAAALAACGGGGGGNDSAAVTYDALKANAAAVTAIQTIWSTAESELKAGYKYTGEGSPFRLLLDVKFLEAAYSKQGLVQLDAFGIEHAPRSAWLTTYLR